MRNDLQALLKTVQKPAQYLGGELNAITRADVGPDDYRVLLVFPDKYEIGMSHIGLKILYKILNQMPGVSCERCFAPDLDMEESLRQKKIPLFSLETQTPLNQFDLIGFSLTYELTYTNMLAILDLAGIPVWQKERDGSYPLIIAGGGCMTNAEPVADFLDAACIGDGEELIGDIIEVAQKFKKSADDSQKTQNRTQVLEALSEIEGVYVPSLFKIHYFEDGRIQKVEALKPGYEQVNKRVLKEIDSATYPTDFVVPNTKLVHDRIGIEIQRGCNRACRFCQAGYIDRPVRQRSPETILKIAEESLAKTGLDQVSLLSLSAADYGCLVDLLKEMNSQYAGQNVALSVPATRTEKLSPELIEQIKKVRKTGFTIAPEAGSPRMRRVINKGNLASDLYQAVENAFSQGWQLLKLYYMVGLPFENEEDIIGIANEANESMKICRRYTKRAKLKLGVSSFVPKPHTPFQWQPQMTIQETKEKYHLVRKSLRDRNIYVSNHHPEMSYLEGIFSRGDRRVAKLIYLGFKLGLRFDEWDEHFNFAKWQEAIKQWGLDPAFYLHRVREKDEILPWDHLFGQMDKKFLWKEFEKAHDEAFTEDCSIRRCTNCGVCDFRQVKNRIYMPGLKDELLVKKGNREWYGWQNDQNQASSNSNKQKETVAQTRYRANFKKEASMAYLGHLEMVTVFKRAFLRAKLPMSYSQGYNPKPKVAFSPPLALGTESQDEYIDFCLDKEIDSALVFKNLQDQLPEGLTLKNLHLLKAKPRSLFEETKAIEYKVEFNEAIDLKTMALKLADFKNQKTWLYLRAAKSAQKKAKEFDLKEFVDIQSVTADSLKIKILTSMNAYPKLAEVFFSVFGISEMDQNQICITKTKTQGDFFAKTASNQVDLDGQVLAVA